MFDEEMKYLHDNGFRVITLSDIGYGENSHFFHIKAIGVAHRDVGQIMQNTLEVPLASFNNYEIKTGC